jgi:phosphoglycerate dehydrogenase-like enzyme/predicted dehydrogenase
MLRANEIPPGMTTMRPVRALVIGAGPAAVAMHLPPLARLRDSGEIELAVVCDIDHGRAERARRDFGFCEESGDAAAVLQRPDIGVVYIFGSAQLHYEYGLLALQNGKHLFVEKPIAPSQAQARELSAAAESRGLTAVGGHNRRFYKSLAAVRARAGKAGWRSVEAIFHKPEYGKPVPFGARTWLSANGIHALDAMLFTMGGLPEHLTALAGDAGTTPPSIFSALMRWPDGAQGVFLCNNDAGVRREEYVFHGIAETCSVTDTALTVEKDGLTSRIPLASLGDGVAAEHDAFIEGIRSGVPPLHSISALVPSLFLAELIESGFRGRVDMPTAENGVSRPQIGTSILIANCSAHQAALARLLPKYRLVSIEHVDARTESRPDIRAAILGRGSSALSADILCKLPQLGVAGLIGLSLARHDPEALLARGIALVNASEAYAESVAEFALGLAILGRRRAFASNTAMRAGGWGTRPRPQGMTGWLQQTGRAMRPTMRSLGIESLASKLWKRLLSATHTPQPGNTAARDLRGAAAGLIGWGANARAFAAKLAQAQARVLVYSEHAAADDIIASGATPASLDEVLAADIVSLHRGLTPRTRHFLGAPELDKLRAGTVLINVARGALIEPDALIARLRRGDIFACLDTYEEEPLPRSHPLRKIENVFLTSHIAGGSPDMHAAAADEVIGKVIAHLEGDSLNTVSIERLRNMT